MLCCSVLVTKTVNFTDLKVLVERYWCYTVAKSNKTCSQCVGRVVVVHSFSGLAIDIVLIAMTDITEKGMWRYAYQWSY